MHTYRHRHENLYLGPDDTYFCLGINVPQGWEWRTGECWAWKSHEISEGTVFIWYQVRPPRRKVER